MAPANIDDNEDDDTQPFLPSSSGDSTYYQHEVRNRARKQRLEDADEENWVAVGTTTPDPRFNPAAPSMISRILLLLFLAFLLWLAFTLRLSMIGQKKHPKVTYATRYSDEHKFRPAASPVITETLADGRLLIRGTTPPAAAATENATPGSRRKKTLRQRTRESGRS